MSKLTKKKYLIFRRHILDYRSHTNYILYKTKQKAHT